MAYWILTQKGTVIPWRSISWLTLDEYSVSNEVEKAKRAVYIFFGAVLPVCVTSVLPDGIQDSYLTLCHLRSNVPMRRGAWNLVNSH